MNVQCPSCGFQGKLPDHLNTRDRVVRCPKCKARFGGKSEYREPPETSVGQPKPEEIQVDSRVETTEAQTVFDHAREDIESQGSVGFMGD